MHRMRRGRILAGWVALTLAAGCAGGPEETSELTLLLDFVPGGIHTGLYAAGEEGYFGQEGLQVDIQPPASSADTLRLVLAGRASVGIAPIGDVAALRAEGEPVKIFMALEQAPLVSLITTRAIGVSDPSQLAGSTVGVTGVPSDEIIARFILESSGVDTATVDFITIGFDAVGNLIGRTVDAAIGFWSAEAVALEMEGEEPVVFRPEDYGAPPFPELVFFTTDDTVARAEDELAAFARAVARGYRFALDDPDSALDHLVSATDGVDREFAAGEFEQVRSHFLDDEGGFGTIDPETLDAYLAWAAEVGIIDRIPDDLLTTRFLP